MKGVREILTKMDGVKSVDVDFGKRLATITTLSDKFNADEAIAALNAEEYGPSKVVNQ